MLMLLLHAAAAAVTTFLSLLLLLLLLLLIVVTTSAAIAYRCRYCCSCMLRLLLWLQLFFVTENPNKQILYFESILLNSGFLLDKA